MVFTEQPPAAPRSTDARSTPVPSREGPVPSLEDPAPSLEDIVSAFVAVMGRIGQHFFHRSAEFDLSPQQAKAFHELREPLSMGELADRLFCDASNVTGIVDRLEARGLVERQPDPDDRRVRRLVLTPTGRDLWQVHHDRVFENIPCVAHLSDDDRRTLCGLLRRMADGPPGGQ
jgi:MarR family transcriptional regulator, organic hydroperoxide resistance regulator